MKRKDKTQEQAVNTLRWFDPLTVPNQPVQAILEGCAQQARSILHMQEADEFKALVDEVDAYSPDEMFQFFALVGAAIMTGNHGEAEAMLYAAKTLREEGGVSPTIKNLQDLCLLEMPVDPLGILSEDLSVPIRPNEDFDRDVWPRIQEKLSFIGRSMMRNSGRAEAITRGFRRGWQAQFDLFGVAFARYWGLEVPQELEGVEIHETPYAGRVEPLDGKDTYETFKQAMENGDDRSAAVKAAIQRLLEGTPGVEDVNVVSMGEMNLPPEIKRAISEAMGSDSPESGIAKRVKKVLARRRAATEAEQDMPDSDVPADLRDELIERVPQWVIINLIDAKAAIGGQPLNGGSLVLALRTLPGNKGQSTWEWLTENATLRDVAISYVNNSQPQD